MRGRSIPLTTVAAMVMLSAARGTAQETIAQKQVDEAPGPSAQFRKPSKQIRLSEELPRGKLIHAVRPFYPHDAIEKRLHGTILLHLVIAKDGRPAEIRYVFGPIQFIRASYDAVKQWRCEPTLLNGQPIEVDTTVTLVYKLDPPGVLEKPPWGSPVKKERNDGQ